MKKKNATIYYGLIMATYSVGYVTLSAFSSLFLLDIGLTNKAVGILLAVASMVSVLIQPYIGALIDKNPKVSTKQVLFVMAMIIALLGLAIIILKGSSMILITGLYGLAVMMLMLSQPFLNALGMDAVNFGYPMNFGLGRSMGSMGYAAGSYAFGAISVMAGAKSVPIAFTIAFVILIVLIYVYPVKKDISIERQEIKDTKTSPLIFFGKYKRLAFVLAGLILIYFSHALINTFALQIIVFKKGTSGDMGTAASIAAICELVTVLLFPVYMKHFKLHKMIRIAGIFFALKVLLSLLAPNMAVFYLIQTVQMFGWGIMSIGIVYYVNYLVGEYDKAQGQAYAGMSYTIGSLIATFIGGAIIDAWGVNTLLILGTVMASIGTVIVWIFADDVNDKIAQ